MLSDDGSTELTFHSFYVVFDYSRFYWTTVKPIQDIIISFINYSLSIVLWSFSLFDLKYPSSYLCKPYFVDCWFVCIIFNWSKFIDPETFSWVQLQKQSPLPRPPTSLWGGLNKYVWFVYGPLTVCNHTQEKVSGSMNFDQLNMIHTNQQSTK